MSLSCQKHNAIIHEYNSMTTAFEYGAKDKCFAIFRWLCQKQTNVPTWKLCMKINIGMPFGSLQF